MSRNLNIEIAKALEHEKYLHDNNYDAWLYHVPNYSSDGNNMLALEKEMIKRGGIIRLYITKKLGYVCHYDILRNDKIVATGIGISQIEPLARALAAYKALTGEEWDGE